MSASGDCTFKIWDLRQPVSTLTVRAHQHEILSADWCKYNDCIVATGSTDKTIRLWDVRMPEKELRTIFAHGYGLYLLCKTLSLPWSRELPCVVVVHTVPFVCLACLCPCQSLCMLLYTCCIFFVSIWVQNDAKNGVPMQNDKPMTCQNDVPQ